MEQYPGGVIQRWRLLLAGAAMLISLALLGALIVISQQGSSQAPPEAVSTAASNDSDSPSTLNGTPGDAVAATPPATVATADDPPPDGGTASPPIAATPNIVPTPVAPSTSASASTVRLEIPAIGVDARVIRMGIDGNGVMEVPRDGELVAWYEFTSQPGAPGNAVMSAHLNYRGSIAVFWRLDDLDSGDRITVVADGERLDYVVSSTYLVRPEDADLREILGGRSGPETITLITCGGVWDAAEREYDHRVIVRATRVS